ncbi:DNA polymerase epsilon subunit 3-like protein [Carex littledalei]|uniref:DNA polymerase epsilon subunit 3-like protein n=1 Tax=Carex littledalei TaxID=544730 RepID=A0A833R2G0_9POAL|nr:DNA polymerase epsilon subunit 3-like protein [Carex littledalei]
MAKKGGGAEAGAGPSGSDAAVEAPPGPPRAPPVPEAEVEELPRSIVRRLVKEKLSELAGDEDVNVNKDALLAFGESARIFIHYLSATANDLCKESKRQTINAEDVLKALDEIEFPEFIELLKPALEDFRKKNAVKRSGAKAKETEKKRKAEQDLTESQAKTGSQEENLVESA